MLYLYQRFLRFDLDTKPGRFAGRNMGRFAMKALFVSPEFEKTFWSWKYLLKFVGKLAAFIPLALLTVAALFPKEWEKELIDLNVLCNKGMWRRLTEWILRLFGVEPKNGPWMISDEKLAQADVFVISGMTGQRKSIEEIVARLVKFGKEIWLGGSILETKEMCNEFPGITRFCVGKGERAIQYMIADYEAGFEHRTYDAKDFGFPSISESPVPLFELADPKHYSSAAIQTSWGCPYECNFCLERFIDGLKWQQKAVEKVLEELSALYRAGYRGAVQIFSSNFAGNIQKAKALSDAVAVWQIGHDYPYEFTVEVAIWIARHWELMTSMVRAGIKKAFLGLENDDEDCLREAEKWQNLEEKLGMSRREAVRRFHQAGMLSLTGIIACGFDNDKPDFADKAIAFVQDTCPIPMIDTLQAQLGTGLWSRLISLGRVPWKARSNTAFLPNFPTTMDPRVLAEGFVKIVKTVWRPKKCYERIRVWLEYYGVANRPPKKLCFADVVAFMRANLWIGLLGGPKTSYYYWRSLLETFFSKKRAAFADVVALWIYRTHFKRATREEVKLAEEWLAKEWLAQVA